MSSFKPIPLSERKIDILLIGFFILNISFITYIVDIEQIIIPQNLYPAPNATNFPEYPFWPPPIFVDLIHWWGMNFDPVLLARPIWWKVTIWWDSLFFGPFYIFAIYAFYSGKEWIRLPSIVYSSVILTILTVILSEELFGDFHTPARSWVLLANAPWVALPLLLLSRCLYNEHLFHSETESNEKDKINWSPFARVVFTIYGLLSAFMAYYVTTYLWCFQLDLNKRFPGIFPRGINYPTKNIPLTSQETTVNLIFDLILLFSFFFQHSIMAKEETKKIFKKAIPPHLYRPTYVILSSFWLWSCFEFWKPLNQIIWEFDPFYGLVYIPFVLGVLMAFIASIEWNHLSLIGLYEAYYCEDTPKKLVSHGLWGKLRQPLLFGYILTFWTSHQMTLGRLVFASLGTLYILIASKWEEKRHLENIKGYANYKQKVKAWALF